MNVMVSEEQGVQTVVSLVSTLSNDRRRKDRAFRALLLSSVGFALLALVTLIGSVLVRGASRLNWQLLSSFPSARPENAGIQSAIFGSIWVVGTAALVAVPIGVATAIYLEEFARRDRRLIKMFDLNIQNLAGVPAVVYGIIGLAFVVRGPLKWGFTIGSAAAVLTMLVLPVIIIISREAIRAVSPSIREAALALGATRWQTVWRQVLPAAIPGISTGSILAVSRAMGESAPLLLLGALAFVTFNPTGLDSDYTILPLMIFRYASDPRPEFLAIAAATSVVLMFILLTLNLVAILVRDRVQRKR
jgi:phosphate transport system permease protein